MKVCSTCGAAKPLEAFHRHRGRADGRQTTCKECKATYNRRYYRTEGHRHVEVRSRHRAALREAVAELIRRAKAVPCADCHRVLPVEAMDLDHVRGAKRGDAQAMRSRMGRSSVHAELAKCDVVCANCHRARTYERRVRDPILRAYGWL
ncbi:hypothetical protein [Euzebya sp.]|uniref:hypothetical protein n=1 Tax=Euzebya sp. TaxID=1971409 RepID=UPI0035180A05